MNKLNESWDDEIKKGLEYGWYSDGTSLYAKTRDDMLNVIDFMESEELLTKRGAELITNKINQLSISEDKNIRISFPEGQMKDLIIYIADADGKNEEMVDAIEDFYDIEDEAMTENKKLNEDKDEELEELSEEEETLPEAIERASEEESSAIDTYEGILDKVADDEVVDDGLKEMIEEIKTDEENHKELLDHYAETGEALTDEELEELDSEDDESDKDSEDLEVVEEAPNVELNTTSTILNGIKDEINNRCKGLVTAETVTIDDAVGLKLTRKTDKLDLISIFDNIVEVMNQHKIQKGDYEIELRGDNLILAMKNMTVNENKKLEESHMNDYSADKKYKVTYINGEGKEKETEYKPSKNTNIAGVQKNLAKRIKISLN